MPPIPVAAPSTGMTCDGWLWLSWATARPSTHTVDLGEVDDPGVLARAQHHVAGFGGQVLLEHRALLL